MPGAVVAVHVAEGERVEEGQVLLVVEAMKMEHALAAPHAGVVVELPARAGDQVVVDQLLRRREASLRRGGRVSTALPGLPARVEVYEVGPRDGLQNESAVVPVEVEGGVRPAAARGRADARSS